jgi:hypothetical protein
MKKVYQTLISPRSIERSPNLYRGVIMKLSDVALSGLAAVGTNARGDEEGGFANWGENSGTYATSDIRTARLYADTGALINRQTNKIATRNKDDWTVGVVRHIDNGANELGFDRAKPRKWLMKLDKWVSHYVMGRTEYITEQEIPDDKTSVREVYLFQGGKVTLVDLHTCIDLTDTFAEDIFKTVAKNVAAIVLTNLLIRIIL